MKKNNVSRTAVDTISPERAKELNHGLLLRGREVSVKEYLVYAYESQIKLRISSDELIAPISLPLSADKWENGECKKHATVAESYELLASADADDIDTTFWNGWTCKKVFYTYVGLADDLERVMEVALAKEAGETAVTDSAWAKKLSAFDEETAEAQNGVSITPSEGAKIKLYAYNQNGDYRFTTYKMSLKGVCGMTAVADKYPLYEEYASNSQNKKDAEKFEANIKEAEAIIAK